MNTNRCICLLALACSLHSLGCALSRERLDNSFKSVPISLEDLPPQVLTSEEKASLPEGTKFFQFGKGYMYKIVYPDGFTISRAWDGKPVERIHGGII